MADAVAPVSVLKALLPLVTTAVVELGKLGWDAEGKLADLKKNLELIKSYLRETETTSNAGVVGYWLKQLQDVTGEVQKEVAELVKIADQIANRRENLEGAIPGIMTAVDSVKLGFKVDNINQKLDKIVKRATDLGLLSRVTLGSATSSSVKETDPFLGDPALVVPRDADVSKVVDMLINCSSTNCSQALPVVSIVGMAGLGKTTLAKLVLKDGRLKSLVEKRRQLWVCVSASFDVDRILCQILEDLTGATATSFEKLKRPTIVAKIEEKLDGKSFLIVLDDVWNEDTVKWDQLMACLFGIRHSDKSIILATTRSHKVVLAMRSPQEFTHQISMLDVDQCWSIIKAKSFGESHVPHNFEVIGKEIGKKCKGVALVASVIGGTMQIERTEDEWSLIKESNLWNSLESDEEIISVLRLSYDRLGSDSLKKCFEFCSIFPEDSFLYREELIKLWMAAGFLDSSLANDQCSHTTLWGIGNKNFNLLVSHSLFQDVVRDDHYDNIVKCKMHDSVRTLARSLSKAMALISDTKSSIEVSSIPHLNIIGVESEQAQRLIKGNALQSLFCGIDTFNRISNKCKGLKILKLVGRGKKSLNSVGQLKDLRYFDVSFTDIEELPKSIVKLKKLQTLNVRGCSCLEELPKQMEKLVELSHLYFYEDEVMPINNIGSLRSLQTLRYFSVGVEKGRGIEELGRLSHLQGVLRVVNLEHVRCMENAREAKLNEKKGIYKLIFEWGWNREKKKRVEDEEGVLEGLQPHLNLKGLEITRYMGRDFPTWLPYIKNNYQILLQNLIRLKLDSCSNCEKLPSLGHLPNLTYLHLSDMDSVKSIDTDFYGGGNFPSLKRFEILEMRALEEWVGTTDQRNMFPSLENLLLCECNKLRSCNILADLSKCSVDITIHGCNNLEFLPSFHELQSLTSLTLSRCNKLLCAPNGLQCCTAIEKLILKLCPKMMYPGLDFLGSLERLATLVIRGCGGVNSLGDSSEQGLNPRVTHLKKVELEAVQLPYFLNAYLHASLESLTLRGNSEIKCLPDQIQPLTALRTLELYGFDGLEALPQWFGDLSSLQELHFRQGSCCWNLRSISPLKAMGRLKQLTLCVGQREGSEGGLLFPPLFDTIHLCLPSSLQRLTLDGDYNHPVSTLPPLIQHMTTLKELDLINICGITAFPEWLQNLSSLQQLVIWHCSHLTYLPNLSNINLSLKVWNCPELLPSFRHFKGSYTDLSKNQDIIFNHKS